MKKLKLDLDDLKVESFTTTAAGDPSIVGYVSCPTCGQPTCNTCAGQITCDATCPDTCEFGCSRPFSQCCESSGGHMCQ